jgi:TM2 domain-containing membrane protein YozV
MTDKSDKSYDIFDDKAGFPAMLSFLFPGLGQIYNKDKIKGISMMILGAFDLYLIWYKNIGVGSLLTIPLRIWSVVDAYYRAKKQESGLKS